MKLRAIHLCVAFLIAGAVWFCIAQPPGSGQKICFVNGFVWSPLLTKRSKSRRLNCRMPACSWCRRRIPVRLSHRLRRTSAAAYDQDQQDGFVPAVRGSRWFPAHLS